MNVIVAPETFQSPMHSSPRPSASCRTLYGYGIRSAFGLAESTRMVLSGGDSPFFLRGFFSAHLEMCYHNRHVSDTSIYPQQPNNIIHQSLRSHHSSDGKVYILDAYSRRTDINYEVNINHVRCEVKWSDVRTPQVP